MAKLSAHKRVEVAPRLVALNSTYAFMSDGAVLSKNNARGGWSVAAKVASARDYAAWLELHFMSRGVAVTRPPARVAPRPLW